MPHNKVEKEINVPVNFRGLHGKTGAFALMSGIMENVASILKGEDYNLKPIDNPSIPVDVAKTNAETNFKQALNSISGLPQAEQSKRLEQALDYVNPVVEAEGKQARLLSQPAPKGIRNNIEDAARGAAVLTIEDLARKLNIELPAHEGFAANDRSMQQQQDTRIQSIRSR